MPEITDWDLTNLYQRLDAINGQLNNHYIELNKRQNAIDTRLSHIEGAILLLKWLMPVSFAAISVFVGILVFIGV